MPSSAAPSKRPKKPPIDDAFSECGFFVAGSLLFLAFDSPLPLSLLVIGNDGTDNLGARQRRTMTSIVPRLCSTLSFSFCVLSASPGFRSVNARQCQYESALTNIQLCKAPVMANEIVIAPDFLLSYTEVNFRATA